MGYRGIIKAERSFEKVLSYEPKKIQPIDSSTMDNMVMAQQAGSEFKIAEVVRSFTGLKELEQQEVETAIERRALEQLKSIEEKAYKEAFELGLEEGRKEAFKVYSEKINEKLQALEELINQISNMKTHFLNSNENHLITLVYHLAKRIAFSEISEKYNEVILNVLSESVKLAHSEEKIRVHVSGKQIEFLETLQKENSRDLEFLRQIDLVADDKIEVGGCVIATNYSEVDARIEQRVEQLWLALKDTIPPVKDVVS
jgi:flagellar assembly protein FliH